MAGVTWSSLAIFLACVSVCVCARAHMCIGVGMERMSRAYRRSANMKYATLKDGISVSKSKP